MYLIKIIATTVVGERFISTYPVQLIATHAKSHTADHASLAIPTF